MKRSFPYHLCQPDEKKSCAACCGIYNFRRNERTSVGERLRRNTTAVSGVLSGEDRVILAHRDRWREKDNGPEKLFVTIFNCEFVGFLDAACRRVGCLLHPTQHHGRDLREHSFYGASLCDGHFCLSYYSLSSQEQRLVIETVEDWYLYGLTITDVDLVTGVYAVLSDMVGEAIDPLFVGRYDVLATTLRWFFSLKLHWPFRSTDYDGFGKYLFRGEEYREITIPYRRLGRTPSRYHKLFLSYGSHFQRGEEIDRAEQALAQQSRVFTFLYEALREEEERARTWGGT